MKIFNFQFFPPQRDPVNGGTIFNIKKSFHKIGDWLLDIGYFPPKAGFTLIEILVVMGLIGILLTIVLVAINPQRQFAQANDTKRRSDVNALLNAITQYAADNAGILPPFIEITPRFIAKGAGNADICTFLVTRFLAALPRDPFVAGSDITDCNASYNTGYEVYRTSADNRITVLAPNTQLAIPAIQVTK